MRLCTGKKLTATLFLITTVFTFILLNHLVISTSPLSTTGAGQSEIFNWSLPEVQADPRMDIRDNPFIAYTDSVIKDTRTGLEWYYRNDEQGRGVTDDTAREWVRKLAVGDGGWRLPTLKELHGLYKTGSFNKGRKAPFYLDDDFTGNRSPVFWQLQPFYDEIHKCSNMYVWSCETEVEIRGVFLGSGVSTKVMKSTKNTDNLLFFDFTKGKYYLAGSSSEDGGAAMVGPETYLIGLFGSRPEAGVFAVRKSPR
jgi:hypothetical protein